MKIFILWTLKSYLLLGTIIIFIFISGEAKVSYLEAFGITSIGAFLLGTLFYILEKKYIPWRKVKLVNKLTKLFNAKLINDNVMHFEIEGFNIFTTINLNLKLSLSQIDAELINFHIPKQEIDNLEVKPNFTLKSGHCNNLETYFFYQTNGLGLKLAKKRFLKKLSNPHKNSSKFE